MDIKKEKEITSERVRVIVAFGDIHGYRQWIKRAATSIEKHFELTEHIYKKAMGSAWVNKYHLKLLGDGFILVKEIGPGDCREVVLKFMREMYDLTIDIQNTIKSFPFPRPAGFRVRLVAGYVTKLKMNFCDIESPCEMRSDYVGYTMVMSNRLLYYMEDVPCICHESVKELTGESPKADGFYVEMYKLADPSTVIPGVDEEDLKALYSYAVKVNDR